MRLILAYQIRQHTIINQWSLGTPNVCVYFVLKTFNKAYSADIPKAAEIPTKHNTHVYIHIVQNVFTKQYMHTFDGDNIQTPGHPFSGSEDKVPIKYYLRNHRSECNAIK